MAYELEYKSSSMPQFFHLPRRFPNFDEAWETAKKLVDVYNMSNEAVTELRFHKVE